jgi:hypothetical protein
MDISVGVDSECEIESQSHSHLLHKLFVWCVYLNV